MSSFKASGEISDGAALFGLLIVMVLGGLLLSVGDYAWGYVSCGVSLSNLNANGQYTYWNGCLVELDNGKRVALGNYRGIAE